MKAPKRIKGIRGAPGTKAGGWSGGVVLNEVGEIRFALGVLFAGMSAVAVMLLVIWPTL